MFISIMVVFDAKHVKCIQQSRFFTTYSYIIFVTFYMSGTFFKYISIQTKGRYSEAVRLTF